MRQILRYGLPLCCAIGVVSFATASRAEDKEPTVAARHMLSGHLVTAPLYFALMSTSYEPVSGAAPLNVGLRLDYEYGSDSTRVGVGVRYHYIPYFGIHEVAVPLLLTMGKNLGDGSTIGVTLGIGYYAGINKDTFPRVTCPCPEEYRPQHGAHAEALFLYTKEISEGADFSFRTGINAAIAMIGDGADKARYSFPLEIGFRKRW